MILLRHRILSRNNNRKRSRSNRSRNEYRVILNCPDRTKELHRTKEIHTQQNERKPRSTVTNSVNDRLRPYTTPYTTVYIPYTLRIRPYFSVLHGRVLRSYISVTVYGEIRRNTETVYGAFTIVNDRIFLVYGRKRSCFQYIRHKDGRF